MIQCIDCEYYQEYPDGRRVFRCDPFRNIKEPECLNKWQLLRLDVLVSHYQAMVAGQQKMAPMQDARTSLNISNLSSLQRGHL